MNLDLRSLKHLVVLARHLSFTKAAQELCLTQSALTRSVQASERHLQTRLFDRDRSGVHLTRVGVAFVERAAALLREAQDLEHMLQRSSEAQIGKASFGMGPLAAQALLPNVLPQVFAARPELRTHVMVRNVETLLAALLQEDIEFIICPEDPMPDSAPLASAFLGWFPMSLLVRAGHPILERRIRARARGPQRHAYPLLSPGRFRETGDWPRYARPYLSGPLHVIEDYGAAARVTEFTEAIWLCSTFAAAAEIRAGRLQEIPAPRGQRPLRFRMMLYSLDKRSLSPAAMMFRDLFQQRIGALHQEGVVQN